VPSLTQYQAEPDRYPKNIGKDILMRMLINKIDHIVLTVSDRERALRFYRDVLGMDVETFGNNRLALRFGDQKINIHVSGQEIEPHAAVPTPGSADVCFTTTLPVAEIVEGLKKQGVAVELGPVPRTGAMGAIISVYLRDPDGNLIEIANQAE
jgi:Lactoylglutathione lyase and related lyases